MSDTPAPARICPHCGKALPKPIRPPRDLKLLKHHLIYAIPIEAEITEAVIEQARRHCRMKPERLAEFRTGIHARHWARMLERRAARLAYFKTHGKEPPPWMPLFPGENDHRAFLEGALRYRFGGLAKLKATLRRNPEAGTDELLRRYLAARGIPNPKRREAALDQVAARLVAYVKARKGEITLAEFDRLTGYIMADEVIARRARKEAKRKPKGTGSTKTALWQKWPWEPRGKASTLPELPGGAGIP